MTTPAPAAPVLPGQRQGKHARPEPSAHAPQATQRQRAGAIRQARLLETGLCSAGHTITDAADLALTSTGARCARCVDDANREARETGLHNPRGRRR